MAISGETQGRIPIGVDTGGATVTVDPFAGAARQLGAPRMSSRSDALGTQAAEFTAVWDPATDPHIEIVGVHGTGKTAAAAAIADAVLARGGAVWPIAHPTLSCDRRRTAEEIEAAIRAVSQEMSVRYSLLEENEALGIDHLHRLPPLLVVVDEFDQLDQTLSDPRQRVRVHDLIGDLLALGRSARVHLVACSTRPHFALGENRSMVSHVALGPLGAQTLSLIEPWPTAHIAPRPIGSGWFFRHSLPAVPVRF